MNPRLRYEVLRRDGFRCQACGASASEGVALEVDHVMPRALGGTDTAANLSTLCRPCNAGKGSSLPDELVVDSVIESVESDRVAVETYAEHLDNLDQRFGQLWAHYGLDGYIDAVTVDQLILAGATWQLLERGVAITAAAPVKRSFRTGEAGHAPYFIGVMRKIIDTARTGSRWWA